MPGAARGARVHYAWLVVATGTLCLFACLGLGRFALGMLLPSMAHTLQLSYAQMGSISTANFLGYLAAVLVSGFVVRKTGTRRLIFAALLLVALSMALIGRAESFYAVAFLYLLTGVGSGAANVPMMGLVTAWFTRRARGTAAGFIVTGSGYAILLTGWLFPLLNRLRGSEGWRAGWFFSAATVALAAVVCLVVLRDRPGDLGLKPFGEEEGESGVAGPFDPGVSVRRVIARLGALYFLFGFTYVIYVTFVVTFLVEEHGYPEAVAGRFWSAVGLMSLLSGPVFGSFSDRWGRQRGLMVVFSIQSASYFLAASGRGEAALYASVALFGLVAWSIPSIMAALAGDLVGPVRAAGVFGTITFIFGIGQTAGPALAGLLADSAGSFRPAFALAGVLAAAASLFSLFPGASMRASKEGG